ncbi:SH3 domain-containing kinase-binding protein 1-like isoform X2 [Dysidea avara]|uniref:SH3 domain-containing kinase-binding protein 1-like isoform X2 n=1 Tax=Dysidea avara TaxID=196820 RepID=UPI00332FE614
MAETVEVLYDYDAEQPDELTLRVGNIIKSCRAVEDGWMEGEINGKRGIFPDNFVKKAEVAPPVPVSEPANVPLRGRSGGSNKLRKAKARFSYHPEAEDELELADGDEVIILDVIEDGWWKGRVGTKEGVFPSNFVEEIPEVNEPTPPPAVAPTEPPPPSTGRPGVKLPALGGFDPANLRANLRRTPQQQPPQDTPKDIKKDKPPLPTSSPKLPHKPPVVPSSTASHPPPPVQRASATTPAKKMARVMFDYEATQEDELSIKVDDTVEVIIDEKDPAEPGWVKVKLGNKVGMVPDNFIEIKKETAKVPTPPLPSREETNPPTAKENEAPPRRPGAVPLPGVTGGRPPPPAVAKKTAPKPPGKPSRPHDNTSEDHSENKPVIASRPPPPVTSRPEKPIDFDMIPKTERLDNQAAVTRPKMTHNPPSRTHIHKTTSDQEESQPKQDEAEIPPWKRELQQKKTREPKVPPSIPSTKPTQPTEHPPTSNRPELPTSTTPAVSAAPVIKGASEESVKQLKDELASLKKIVEELRTEYKKDIEILTQDLDEERKKVAGLQVEIDRLKKSKGFR